MPQLRSIRATSAVWFNIRTTAVKSTTTNNSQSVCMLVVDLFRVPQISCRSHSLRLPVNGAPTSVSVTPSASVYRWDLVVHTPLSSVLRMSSSATCPAVSSVFRKTVMVMWPCACRCKPASNTFVVRKRRATSAQRKRCSQ